MPRVILRSHRPGTRAPRPRNLVLIHLESIGWQTLASFPDAFPNLSRFMPTARAFRWYFSSATSTQMVLAYLCHGNDFELDAATGLSRPAGNNPSLFSTLRAAGYHTDLLCVSALHETAMLPQLAGSLPKEWVTDDFRALQHKFESLADARPFAVLVWNLVTHAEHAMALAPVARGLDDMIGGACAVADRVLGALLATLEGKGLMDDTAVVIYGDHGEDYWMHGFKAGFLHGMEPYSHLVHAPLVIRDTSLPAGSDLRLAGTIDLAPTCLDLLGLPADLPFAHSGRSLVRGPERQFAFSQNFTANQPDATDCDIRKAFSVSDRSHTLLVSARGLEYFNHRLDPANHVNLLHFFDMDDEGNLAFRHPDANTHPHFVPAMHWMLSSPSTLRDDFRRLREALAERVATKRAYVAARTAAAMHTLDPSCLDRPSRDGRERFFGTAAYMPAAPRGPGGRC